MSESGESGGDATARWIDDPRYLQYQYGDSEKLRIRKETHDRYTERAGPPFHDWILSHLRLEPRMRVIDVGSGPGFYHAKLAEAGCRVVAVDLSLGMLREAAAAARTAGRPVFPLAADAERLPLAASCGDAVLANHMLYHVRDREAALRELRRVRAPGGPVVLATNASEFGWELHELHREAAEELGYAVDRRFASRFTLEDVELVRGVFPDARVHRLENAFAFPTAEAALRYYATGGVDWILDPPPDNAHRSPLLRRVEERIAEIIARDGMFRVTKTTGCFVA